VGGPISYRWPFDGGPPINGRSASYTSPHASPHTVALTVRDAAGNTTTTTRDVEVSGAAVTPPPPLQPPPSTLPDPVAGQTLNVFLVSGVVLIQEPGSKKFVPLTKPSQIRNGSILDARKGRVEIVI